MKTLFCSTDLVPQNGIFCYNERKMQGGHQHALCKHQITKEGNVTPEQKRALIEGATNLLHDVLGKNKSTTVVTIDEVDTDNWGIGGVPVTEIRKNAAAKK